MRRLVRTHRQSSDCFTPRMLWLRRNHLDLLGLEVMDVKPYDFQTWLDKATVAKETALREYPQARKAKKSYEFDSDLWGQLKEHLQDLFHGRCAYCEAWFQSVSFGDVEHYRPKAEVTDDRAHPGYYWLAYDQENYLPSCSQCNTKGKGNHFPIKGTRVSTPDSLWTKRSRCWSTRISTDTATMWHMCRRCVLVTRRWWQEWLLHELKGGRSQSSAMI